MSVSVPFIPENAPFSPEQRAWLNGFLAGLFSRGPVASVVQTAAAPALAPLAILFGSQTGTAERLAKRSAKEAGKRGYAPVVLDMASVDASRLAQEKNVLVIASTYGDGEPPDNAKRLLTQLKSEAGPALGTVRFAVCGLGDRNYARFCQCGADFDAALEKRGAVRVVPKAECDVDYETAFSRWLDAALGALAGAPSVSNAVATTATVALADVVEEQETYTKENPFPALLLASRVLNAEGSAKEVRHVEFSLEGSGLSYEPGDALGVLPQNCPELVADVLEALGCDGEEAVAAPDGTATSLRHALTAQCDLGKPTEALLAAYAPAASADGKTSVAVAAHHVIDLLLAYPDMHFTPAAFVALLRKLQPRLYSISSSLRAHPQQVHLTVGAVRYELQQRTRKGVCSTFLADRAAPGTARIGVYPHRNKAFRLPVDPMAPIIMVGPGTGIAPFRSFLQEREATGAKGKNWLFFGDQRAATDFLYRDYLEASLQKGTLHRLDTAFSRDQTEKIYVQHRMLEQAKELYAWLESGAHFYVCGDAQRMAKDVDLALHRIVETAGGKTSDQAADYVETLRMAGRYRRDVY